MAGRTHPASSVRDRPAARRLGALIAAALLVAACGAIAPSSATPASLGPTASPAAAVTATPAAPSASPSAVASPTPSATPGPTVVRTPTPPPAPTPRPTSRPTATPPPTAKPPATPPPTLAPSAAVRHGSRSGNDVALTFDMGGRVGDAVAIVDWLVGHGVHATVFMTGAMADNTNTDAGRQVLAVIAAHPGLITLGNHSYTHPDFRTLTAAQMAGELRRTEAALAPYCSQDPRPFFRPPYGGYSTAVLAAVGSAGYRWTVLWDVDTIDWRPIANDPPGPTADEIVAKVLGNAQGGSIVLMHLGGYETYAALPRIVDGLTAAGLDLVNLDRLLGG